MKTLSKCISKNKYNIRTTTAVILCKKYTLKREFQSFQFSKVYLTENIQSPAENETSIVKLTFIENDNVVYEGGPKSNGNWAVAGRESGGTRCSTSCSLRTRLLS